VRERGLAATSLCRPAAVIYAVWDRGVPVCDTLVYA